MFHSQDGLYFRREPNDCVTIIKTTDQLPPCDDGSNILFQQSLMPGTWASAICSVSSRGEDFERWQASLLFHGLRPVDAVTQIV